MNETKIWFRQYGWLQDIWNIYQQPHCWNICNLQTVLEPLASDTPGMFRMKCWDVLGISWAMTGGCTDGWPTSHGTWGCGWGSWYICGYLWNGGSPTKSNHRLARFWKILDLQIQKFKMTRCSFRAPQHLVIPCGQAINWYQLSCQAPAAETTEKATMMTSWVRPSMWWDADEIDWNTVDWKSMNRRELQKLQGTAAWSLISTVHFLHEPGLTLRTCYSSSDSCRKGQPKPPRWGPQCVLLEG